jgi:hypothetical protein
MTSSRSGCIRRAVGNPQRGEVFEWFLVRADRWNGSSWASQSTPDPSGATNYVYNELFGVFCTAATACTAVGGYTTYFGTGVTLAERSS